MAKRSGTVVALRPKTTTVEAAAHRFLSERDLTTGTRRVYGDSFAHLVEAVGDIGLDEVTTEQIEGHLVGRWGKSAPATYNRNLATLQSLFSWAVRRRLVAHDPTEGIERRKARTTRRQAELGRAIPYDDLARLWDRKDIELRERVLWRMLYETAARSYEVLALNVENLDQAEKMASIKSKAGNAQYLHYATLTARLLPRYLNGRTCGPLFLTDRAPRQPMAKADIDPASGHGRLSYRRAAELFTEASGGLTLHQLRHSALTHLAEDGVDVALLKAKSRHKSLRSLERYVRPSEAAVARLTANHDRARRY